MVHHQKEGEQSILCFFLKKTFFYFVIEKNRKEGKEEEGSRQMELAFDFFTVSVCTYVVGDWIIQYVSQVK
jgi:hypothetical protein